MPRLLALAISCLMLVAVSCSRKPADSSGAKVRPRPVGELALISVPLGLPALPLPADNPPTLATIALGRRLFYDPLLSADGTVSCATCHDPANGFADSRPVSLGVGKKAGKRNAPTVWNAAYQPVLFWDGRAASLEEQAEGPMMNPVEMAHAPAGIEERLNGEPTYRADFERAFGVGPVTLEKVKMALASFERTVLSGNSAFDRYYFGGEKSALSEAARRGFEVFRDAKRGNCTACHVIGKASALFTDGLYHNVGAGLNPKGELTDLGRYEITHREEDRGAFRTPTLRNISLTAPYMHDGSLKTLKEVVDFYVGGGNANPWLDPQIKPLTHLTGQQRSDLVAFLKSLTGETPPNLGAP